MPFNTDYKTMVSGKGEPLSEGTKKIYRAALNKIARAGYDDKAALLANQSAVLKVIDELAKDATKKRLFLSAVFKVLNDVDLPLKMEYYEAFQKVRDTPTEYAFTE